MNTYRKHGTSSMAYLEICEVTKRFPGGVVAVDHISLSVEKGEIRAILGENGAGKATLMNILVGFSPPQQLLLTSTRVEKRIRELSQMKVGPI